MQVIQHNKYYTTGANFNTGKQIDESGNLALLQTTDYYPFGLTMANGNKANADQPYQYGGKEWQNNTQVYDFHARQYNPALDRWFNIDPMLEKFSGISTYNYCANNPINLIDPDGKEMSLIELLDEAFKKAKSGVTSYIIDDQGSLRETEANSFDNSRSGGGGDPQNPPFGKSGNFWADGLALGQTPITKEDHELIKKWKERCARNKKIRDFIRNNLGDASIYATAAGYVFIIIPGTQGLGATLLIVGNTMGTASDVITIADDIKNGNIDYLAGTAAKIAINRALGGSFKHAEKIGRITASDKLVFDGFTDITTVLINEGVNANY